MSRSTGVIDLAAERLGGKALLANDEFFAAKENLLKPGRGQFIEGKYTDRGKWMDGWETRRRREPGHDWCIIRLGIPGVIRGVIVDTNHFKGNYPEYCSIDACALLEEPPVAELPGLTTWRELVTKVRLEGHSENGFPVYDERRYTHLRLNIYPDGGVARFRVLGEARPDWTRICASGQEVDLASVLSGGHPVACSDDFFSEPLNLIMPGRAANMGDGWETRRRRGEGYDWVVLKLGRRGVIDRIEVDTNHFKGNFPDRCSLEACDVLPTRTPDVVGSSTKWWSILPETKLAGDTQNQFACQDTTSPATHVRLNIFPDGGVSRLRLYGRPVD